MITWAMTIKLFILSQIFTILRTKGEIMVQLFVRWRQCQKHVVPPLCGLDGAVVGPSASHTKELKWNLVLQTMKSVHCTHCFMFSCFSHSLWAPLSLPTRFWSLSTNQHLTDRCRATCSWDLKGVVDSTNLWACCRHNCSTVKLAFPNL